MREYRPQCTCVDVHARARMCRYVIHTSLYNMQAADPRIEKSVPELCSSFSCQCSFHFYSLICAREVRTFVSRLKGNTYLFRSKLNSIICFRLHARTYIDPILIYIHKHPFECISLLNLYYTNVNLLALECSMQPYLHLTLLGIMS